MNLIEKIKANKQKQNQTFINPDTVDVVIDNYDEIKKALSSGYSYKDVEVALFDNSVNHTAIADICYIAGKVLEKYNVATAQAENKTETQAENKTETKKGIEQCVSHKPSRTSIAKYMRDNNVSGYTMEFFIGNDRHYRHVLWVASSSAERAKNTGVAYLRDKDQKSGRKNSYRIIDIKKMTYNEYLEKYGYWQDEN